MSDPIAFVALLRRVGEALYGERWQSALSRDLGVNDRTMRRWASGEDMPRHGVIVDLQALVNQRSTDLQQCAELLDLLARLE
jgi:hypothetical protein